MRKSEHVSEEEKMCVRKREQVSEEERTCE